MTVVANGANQIAYLFFPPSIVAREVRFGATIVVNLSGCRWFNCEVCRQFAGGISNRFKRAAVVTIQPAIRQPNGLAEQFRHHHPFHRAN